VMAITAKSRFYLLKRRYAMRVCDIERCHDLQSLACHRLRKIDEDDLPAYFLLHGIHDRGLEAHAHRRDTHCGYEFHSRCTIAKTIFQQLLGDHLGLSVSEI